MKPIFENSLHERTEKLAYDYWERRGRPLGSPEIDWFAAEKALASSHQHSQDDFSLCSLRLEPDEGPYRLPARAVDWH
jgi:Protein of unknown function (DUF2934)